MSNEIVKFSNQFNNVALNPLDRKAKLKAHAAELRAWASDAGVRLPSAESAGELREQVRDLPQEPQIQEQPGYGYQPGFQQPQQWQQQPWN